MENFHFAEMSYVFFITKVRFVELLNHRVFSFSNTKSYSSKEKWGQLTLLDAVRWILIFFQIPCHSISKGLVTTNDEIIIKGAVSRNSAKLGNYKMPVKLRET